MSEIRIGCVSWTVPKVHADRFPDTGSHLERYAARFDAVEINTSFYRHHMATTYARWAAAVPESFRFAVKMSREITHVRRLIDVDEPLDRFLDAVAALGDRLGPLLVQMPPSLRHDAETASTFFTLLRRRFAGAVACEPRHPSWFTPEAETLLAAHSVTRVAADPPPAPEAGTPGGWPGVRYYRLHGSPKIYHSAYPPETLDHLAASLAREAATGSPIWCIFDNTVLGAATTDALSMVERMEANTLSGAGLPGE